MSLQAKRKVPKQDVLQRYSISDNTYRRVLARESDLNNKVKNYEYQNKKSPKNPTEVVHTALTVYFWIPWIYDEDHCKLCPKPCMNPGSSVDFQTYKVII